MDWLGKALGETLIRQCLDQVPGAHYIVDCDCRLKYWSPAAERFTGYPADRMVDEWCREAWPARCNQKGESFCGESCPARKVMRDGCPVDLHDLTLQHAHGTPRPIDVHIAPLHDEGGSIVGAICTLTPARGLNLGGDSGIIAAA